MKMQRQTVIIAEFQIHSVSSGLSVLLHLDVRRS